MFLRFHFQYHGVKNDKIRDKCMRKNVPFISYRIFLFSLIFNSFFPQFEFNCILIDNL